MLGLCIRAECRRPARVPILPSLAPGGFSTTTIATLGPLTPPPPPSTTVAFPSGCAPSGGHGRVLWPPAAPLPGGQLAGTSDTFPTNEKAAPGDTEGGLMSHHSARGKREVDGKVARLHFAFGLHCSLLSWRLEFRRSPSRRILQPLFLFSLSSQYPLIAHRQCLLNRPTYRGRAGPGQRGRRSKGR